MKKSILILMIIAFILPVSLSSCKNDKQRKQEVERARTGTMDDQDTPRDQKASERKGSAMDMAEEKADRLVGDTKAALKKAEDRVKDAEDKIQKAIQEQNDKALERATKEKEKAEKEIETLKQKLKEKDKN